MMLTNVNSLSGAKPQEAIDAAPFDPKIRTRVPTTADLLTGNVITEEQVTAAALAYIGDLSGDLFELADGLWIDLVSAVRGHSFAQDMLASPWASPDLQLKAVRVAIMLARPMKALRRPRDPYLREGTEAPAIS